MNTLPGLVGKRNGRKKRAGEEAEKKELSGLSCFDFW